MVISRFPASKSICQKFSFLYGQTIGVRVTYIQPKVEDNFAEFLFIDHKLIDEFFKIMNNESVELYVKLLFSEESVSNVEANFTRKMYYATPASSFIKIYADELIKKTVVEAEGEMVMLLTRII